MFDPKEGALPNKRFRISGFFLAFAMPYYDFGFNFIIITSENTETLVLAFYFGELALLIWKIIDNSIIMK